MKNLEGRRWISALECSEYLNLHIQTIFSLIYQGKIPSAKIGRSRRIDLTKLNGFLEGQTAGREKGRSR